MSNSNGLGAGNDGLLVLTAREPDGPLHFTIASNSITKFFEIAAKIADGLDGSKPERLEQMLSPREREILEELHSGPIRGVRVMVYNFTIDNGGVKIPQLDGVYVQDLGSVSDLTDYEKRSGEFVPRYFATIYSN